VTADVLTLPLARVTPARRGSRRRGAVVLVQRVLHVYARPLARHYLMRLPADGRGSGLRVPPSASAHRSAKSTEAAARGAAFESRRFRGPPRRQICSSRMILQPVFTQSVQHPAPDGGSGRSGPHRISG